MHAAKTRQRLRAPSRASPCARRRRLHGRHPLRCDRDAIRRDLQAERHPQLRAGLASHVLPDLGGSRLGDVTAADLQALVERLRGQGPQREHHRQRLKPGAGALPASDATRARHHNPCRDVSLPTIRSQREHAADPGDAALMIRVLPEQDQCAWALAFYGGLRLGELGRSLGGHRRGGRADPRPAVVGRARGRDRAQELCRAARRSDHRRAAAVPPAQRARCAWQPTGLALGSSKSAPFSYNGLYRRSAKAWQATGFPRVTPHQARHSFASYLIAAGADVKAVTEIMGHASVRQSFDRYGHLLRDSHANTVTKLDASLGLRHSWPRGTTRRI